MATKRWTRRTLLAVVWAGAASTWASIAHHFFALPDIGLAMVLTVGFAALALPVIRERRSGGLHQSMTTTTKPRNVPSG